MNRNFSTAISSCAYYVPDGKLTHEELVGRFGEETMGKIAPSAGIWERRVALNGECASDLAFRAAQDLLTRHNIDRESIDLLLFATQTPDYILPTTACILQERLGLSKRAAAFDINLGCSQYVYSLAVGHSMIVAGIARRALVMTGDTVSRILHPQDRTVVPLFGDAGSATLLDTVKKGEGFIDFDLGSDGSGHEFLIWPTSGLRRERSAETAREKMDKQGALRRQDDMYMNGPAIFVFTLKVVPDMIKRLLKKTSLTIDDIDLFVFHQASELIVQTSANKLKIPPDKLHYRLHDLGNSGGTTVAIALTDAWLEGRIKPGMNIVLCAFGVGLSWSATLLKWPETTLGPVCTVDYSSSPQKPLSQQCANPCSKLENST